MPIQKKYRGINIERKVINPEVAAIPFVSKTDNVNTRRISEREEGRYRIKGIDSDFNCWRPLGDLKYVIDDMLDNPNSVYNDLLKMLQ